MDSVISIFYEVRDPRDFNARHNLSAMLFIALAATLCGAKSVIAHPDGRRTGAAGKGNPFKVRRMASSAPMAFRRAVSMTDLMSA